MNFFHLVAKRIAVNAEGLGGFGFIAIILFQHLFDKSLLKFTHRILIVDSVLDHLIDKSVQLVFHGELQRCKSYGAAGLVLTPLLPVSMIVCRNFSNPERKSSRKVCGIIKAMARAPVEMYGAN